MGQSRLFPGNLRTRYYLTGAWHNGGVDVEDLRLAVYRTFAETGRAPQVGELARQLGTELRAVTAGLEELARARQLVLGDRGEIVMAHPFSAVPLGFSVMGERTLWWGGCAWDSFALPHLLPGQGEVLVATRCPACGRPLAWNVGWRSSAGRRPGRAFPCARPADVGRRRAYVPAPAAVLLYGLRRYLAGGHWLGSRVRDGPQHAVAVRRALVRRAPGARLHQKGTV